VTGCAGAWSQVRIGANLPETRRHTPGARPGGVARSPSSSLAAPGATVIGLATREQPRVV